MSDIIKLLPDHVANQIAAGEVIQRPASVVKELLENAIDAGSKSVKLIVRDGGKTLIQVIDNGKGMSGTDARLCWERHATSKISAVEDIFKIRTMGFRGEALASIASVAMVELKSKRAEDNVGTLIRIESSEVKAQEIVAAPDGTSISVKNLFYNVPARRNFLKSDSVETRNIIDEFTRIALANPDVAMSMHHNDNETYVLKAGDLAMRIAEMFGHKTPKDILPVDEQTTIVNLSGFVGNPAIAKKTRGEQFFFVNKRFIKDPYLNHALVNCYENLISKEQYPFYVVNIDIDPAQIDVNVHPTKTEIKFEDERAVYQIIRAVCKKALGQHYHIPSPEDTAAGEGMFPDLRTPSSRQDSDHPVRTQQDRSFNPPATKQDWQQLFEVMQNPETIGDIRHDPFPQQQNELVFNGSQPLNRNLMQVHNSLIISQVKTGIMLIDQQAAHERILFEKYLQALELSPVASQQKLFPTSLAVSPADEKLLSELLPDLRSLGFDIHSLGKNTFAINGVPAELNTHNESDLVQSLLEQYKHQSYASFNPHERMARLMARKVSIQPGTSLTSEEMTSLVEELFLCSEPQYAPDGRACVKTLKLEDLYGLMK